MLVYSLDTLQYVYLPFAKQKTVLLSAVHSIADYSGNLYLRLAHRGSTLSGKTAVCGEQRYH